MKKTFLLGILILLVFAVWTYQNQAAEDFDNIKILEKQKGVCWVGSPKPLEGWELDSLGIFGVTHISQTPFGWQSHPKLPDIKWEKHSDKMWWGESLEGVEFTTEAARKEGLESILKPHLWVRGEWPGAIEMTSEQGWNDWFGQYSEFILYYAQYAESHQIPILCIGTELEMTSNREKVW